MATKSIRLSDGTDTFLPESAESGSGYCKFADGTLIQWGEAIIAANSTSITVTFPIAFSSAGYGIGVMGNFANTRDLSWAYAGQTAAKVDIYRGVATFDYAQGIKWLAIGRWK